LYVRSCHYCSFGSHLAKINLKLEVSREASNKGEESKDGDEEKLETVSIKSESEFFSGNVRTDGGGISLALGRTSQESWDGAALLALELGEAIIKYEF